MDDWISFTGRVVAMEWGDSVFTVLPIPDDVMEVLARDGARRVDIELNECPLNLALTRAPAIDQVFVYTGKSVLKEVGLDPGKEVEVRLRKADPDAVDVPADVTLAIQAAELTGSWAALTPGKQRGLVHHIAIAKRAGTRAKRIERLLNTLRG
ncbi:MAG: YdeI/OmpD-associated family protein [Pseudomonadota bacterium]